LGLNNFPLKIEFLFIFYLQKAVLHQENSFLAKFDITLANMDEIYAYTDKKYKLVMPQQKNEKRIDAIRILCKNFRMLTFDFTENCQVGKGKNIADALLKFAFPTRHNLLFMYHNRENYYNASRSVRLYREEQDWYYELERCGLSSRNGEWRVMVHKNHTAEDALPRCFVVPRTLSDEKFADFCELFRSRRAIVWSWGMTKASLLRVADLKPEMINNPKEISKYNLMIEHIRLCGNLSRAPQCKELTKGLPSIQDVQQSYIRLRTLCSPVSDRELMTQDEKFYTQLEKSCWLLYVSLCLKTANECASLLLNEESVVLQVR
jgi:myotubularin-related protein 10/11/12